MITELNIGDNVRQTANGEGSTRIGKVVEIDIYTNRVRIKWDSNRTWFKASRLTKI